jgi:hypothetical protein
MDFIFLCRAPCQNYYQKELQSTSEFQCLFSNWTGGEIYSTFIIHSFFNGSYPHIYSQHKFHYFWFLCPHPDLCKGIVLKMDGLTDWLTDWPTDRPTNWPITLLHTIGSCNSGIRFTFSLPECPHLGFTLTGRTSTEFTLNLSGLAVLG